MEFLLDNPEVDKTFQKIIKELPAMKNGQTVDSMAKRGIVYEKSWGASIVDLKQYSKSFEKNHLLALKLWNKKWRESMIMATLIDTPSLVTEQQMDFWIKTAPNTEIIEQAVINLLTETPFAFAKALEWCTAKKHQVKMAGLLMMGRMALTCKDDIDEMFDTFFEILPLLAKDPNLSITFIRTSCQLARRSLYMHKGCVSLAKLLVSFPENIAQKNGKELLAEIDNNDFRSLIIQ